MLHLLPFDLHARTVGELHLDFGSALRDVVRRLGRAQRSSLSGAKPRAVMTCR